MGRAYAYKPEPPKGADAAGSKIISDVNVNVYAPTFEYQVQQDRKSDKSVPIPRASGHRPPQAPQAPSTSGGIADAVAASFADTADMLEQMKRRSFARDPLRDTGATTCSNPQQKPFVRPPVYRPENQGKAPPVSRSRTNNVASTSGAGA